MWSEAQLLPGDLLVFYTDGLTECASPTGEAYGTRQLRRSIQSVLDAQG